MNPVLKQRKTKIVSGWLTRGRNVGGLNVTLWDNAVSKNDLLYHEDIGFWSAPSGNKGSGFLGWWEDDEFKALYTGIPRKGRAVHVEIEIVVE